MDVLKEHKFDPVRCVIDHNNEETIRDVLDRGYWCAFSIYPQTKMGSERMAVLVEGFGPERLIVDSACDWGVSDPLAVAKTARLMAQRGVSAEVIHQVVYANALAVYGLNGEMDEQHWLAPAAIDQRTLYEGNSVLRGGQSRGSSNRFVLRTICSLPEVWRCVFCTTTNLLLVATASPTARKIDKFTGLQVDLRLD
jgi:Predicted metal-dependent hydrolases with the TIM-barrel fold